MNRKERNISIGIDDFFAEQLTEEERAAGLELGRICRQQRGAYSVLVKSKMMADAGAAENVAVSGEAAAVLKGAVFYGEGHEFVTYPAVGDVVVMKREADQYVIYRVLKRKTDFVRNKPGVISRKDNTNEQVVAANMDTVFIMESLNHDFNLRRLERYITVAWNSGATLVILLTKADICEDVAYYVEQAQQVAIGIDILPISTYSEVGIEVLKTYLHPGKTAVFLGSSGIGKSTLVNLLAGRELMKISGITEKNSKGSHTTTHREMVVLENGAILIDTPGMRELGNDNFEEGLDQTFEDIAELAMECRFSDCSHTSEPGCRVRQAIEDGALSEERLKSYQKLLRESRRLSSKVVEQRKYYQEMKVTGRTLKGRHGKGKS